MHPHTPDTNHLNRLLGGFFGGLSRTVNGGSGKVSITKPISAISGRTWEKLLVNVTVQGSVGPVQVIMPVEGTVQELMKAALSVYEREKRRPLMRVRDPKCFELHYSSFTLESLKLEEKLINLGSRNFFLCQKPASVTCIDQMKMEISRFALTKFMEILL